MKKKLCRERLDSLVRQYAGHLSAEQISDMTGYTQSGVNTAAFQLGISMRLKPKNQRKQPPLDSMDMFLRRSA